MVFRADEARQTGFENVVNYFIRRLDDTQKSRSREMLEDICSKYGPAVDSYPTWHPLVCHHDRHEAIVTPSTHCGYERLDHTRYFANAFITCPYGDGQEILNSIAKLPPHPIASISAEKLDVQLYHSGATPILVTCKWEKPLESDGTIPLSIAMPLILEKEVPCWRWSQVAETWETMRYYLLGSPHGSRSSLFVNQETGQAIKKIWELLNNTGMFGPILLRK